MTRVDVSRRLPLGAWANNAESSGGTCGSLRAPIKLFFAPQVQSMRRVLCWKEGSIICTSSIATNTSGSIHTDYVMSKCAVLGLVKSASYQLGEHGIRVNCVSPRATAMPLICKAFGSRGGGEDF
ncbi:hypothetical protein NC651_033775 [Populus alba x Populus x berolinensis]|nr:hypothetical protein NC651_033775 [Populus alba x Populus x berolinensis]